MGMDGIWECVNNSNLSNHMWHTHHVEVEIDPDVYAYNLQHTYETSQ